MFLAKIHYGKSVKVLQVISQIYEFTVATKTEEGFVKAVQVAQNIHQDLEMGEFDQTLAKYSAKHKRKSLMRSHFINFS